MVNFTKVTKNRIATEADKKIHKKSQKMKIVEKLDRRKIEVITVRVAKIEPSGEISL